MKRLNLWICTGCLAALTAGLIAGRPAGGEPSGENNMRVYELRTYTTHPGRLPALHKRFRDRTLRLFEKHGMKNVAYWTPTDKDNTLVYVISHESAAAAKNSWDAFRNDSEWQKVFKESHKDGPIVRKVESQYLQATDFSPMK